MGKRRVKQEAEAENEEPAAQPGGRLSSARQKRQRSMEGGTPAPAQDPLPNVARVEIDRDELKAMRDKIKEYVGAESDALEKASSWSYLSPQAIEALVGVVARGMLFRQHENPGVPIKRGDLIAWIKAERPADKKAGKLPALVIPMAQAKLATAFGIEMREIRRGSAGRRDDGAAAAAAGAETATYIMQSLLPTGLRRAFVDGGELRDARNAFAMTVLALIQANGGSMDAGVVERHVRQAGVLNDPQADHPLFGRDPLKAQLADLEKRRVLASGRQQGPEGPVICYQWGEVAHDTIGERAVAEWQERIRAAAEQAAPTGGGEDEGKEAGEGGACE